MTSPQTPPVPSAPATQADDRFQRGHMSEQDAQEYAQTVADQDGFGKAELPPEDAGARAARLARRRRLLGWGALPAVLAAVVSIWMLTVSGLTFAGGHSLTHEDYHKAVARYSLVERLNPWVSRWRVLYNLGTAEVFAEQGEAAVAHLTAALEVVPRGKALNAPDGTQVTDPHSDECKVRRNLYSAYYVQARTSSQPVPAEETAAKAQEALGGCEPPAQDNQAQPSPQPSSSQQPSQEPSQDPSQQPSQNPSQDPSQSPSAQPSATPSGQSSPQPSSSPSGSASPSAGPSASASPTPSKAPDPQASALASRNAEQEREHGGVERTPKRRW